MLVTVLLARTAPSLAMNGGLLHVDSVSDYAVAVIFLLSGFSLKLSEMRAAALDFRLNLLTQMLSLGLIPLLAYPLVQLGHGSKWIHGQLLDGLMITACLPTTVNMCVLLAKSAGANTAVALTNAILGNLLGVCVTPALLLLTLGARASIQLGPAVQKLVVKVVVPVLLGQCLRSSRALQRFYTEKSALFKKLSECLLLLIVWNAFSNAFVAGLGVSGKELIFLAVLMPVSHIILLTGFVRSLSWSRIGIAPRDAVAASLVASQKTLAFGLPLIKTIFEGSADLAYFCAPIMLLHPMQL
ncbi:slc10a7, partial [Symbiodinium pilosum]